MDKNFFRKNPYYFAGVAGWGLGIILILWSYLNDINTSKTISILLTVGYFLLFVVASVLIFRRYKEQHFMNWFIMGIIMGISAGVIYGVGYYVRTVYIDPDYTAKATEAAIQHWQDSGMDPKILKRQPQFGEDFQNPGSWSVQIANFTAIVAILVAVVTGGVMKFLGGKRGR